MRTSTAVKNNKFTSTKRKLYAYSDDKQKSLYSKYKLIYKSNLTLIVTQKLSIFGE